MPRITKLLIAGRGEIARRIMRTAREMGIATVAVYADGDVGAPFAREADVAVALRGATAAETYLDIAKIIEAARQTGADAVHPGYGFLAENPEFVSAVVSTGLIWVGPRAEAIAAMGDKLAAKKLMTEAQVPTLQAVEVNGSDEGAMREAARSVGYPLLVKAAAGGGGKGMRMVSSEDDLAEAVAGARREAAGAFGNDTVFFERYLESSRHVEVQVFGDHHGNVVHCFERECSIQRRYQKIIEEAPSPAVDSDLRARLGEAAVAAARAIAYDSAGTVELLLDDAGNFSFLEMNTRLQVEHPVTEEITGLDLVREQIRVAEGNELSFRQEDLTITGHAIEARLYAEDPANDFLPAVGRIVAWRPDPQHPARVESGVSAGTEVAVHFDPMLAKVIVHAPTRTEAAFRLAKSLERLQLHGVVTNRDFLVNVLRHDAFIAGDTRTDFIERHQPARERQMPPVEVGRAALAVALATQELHRAGTRILTTIPSGWRNNPSMMQLVRYTHRGEEVVAGYLSRRDGAFSCEVNGQSVEARVIKSADGQIEVEIDGLRSTFSVISEGANHWVQSSAGEVALVETPRFPRPTQEQETGSYAAPMPGKIVAINVEAGQAVNAGQVLIVLEAMKMEHRITCSEAGIVKELRVRVGEQVDAGQVMLVVEAGEGQS
ncbi:MAG TPA: biotin carboxylase N-terminal domain-containing protein [Dehalococcoidia bacterium]|nr:biotin carboxylase N-terminal domain-containing protein [Dehalococcoidia bacterium]